MERSSSTIPQTHIFFVPNIKGLAQTVLTWEGKVFAAADADAAETDWKHKVTPRRGDLIIISNIVSILSHYSTPLSIPIITLSYPTWHPYYYIIPYHSVSNQGSSPATMILSQGFVFDQMFLNLGCISDFTPNPRNIYIPPLSVSLLSHYAIRLNNPIFTLYHPTQYPYHYTMPAHSVSLLLHYTTHSVSLQLHYAIRLSIPIIKLWYPT